MLSKSTSSCWTKEEQQPIFMQSVLNEENFQGECYFITLFPVSVLPTKSSLFTLTSKPRGTPGRFHLWIGVGVMLS